MILAFGIHFVHCIIIRYRLNGSLSYVQNGTEYFREKDKGKDKEALFNVAYNVTDNISS